MGRKLRHVLIFLLIILKEPSMPVAGCSCEPSSSCSCIYLGLTSIPRNLPTSISKLDLIVVIILIGTFLAVIWKMRRARKPPLGRNPGVVVGNNTNAAASVMATTVMASDDDRQYEGIDNHHDQIGQGQSPANIQSLKVGNLSHDEVLADLQPNPMYLDVKLTPKDDASTEIAKSNDQTGQGQPQAETESLDVRNLSYDQLQKEADTPCKNNNNLCPSLCQKSIN
ncbi:PREDICTED: uncharacterized protein LOC109476467 [Branchiostoma belcheri]|uniref:Uncharacterized protein LOC109476467 n=1 Tax=Branchiostoma belcheri TaxID=7741 RepID=A0A6P4YU73_BRABE|nr:PREDICTED: uncharacterized protein LOC109476467 [Branchiostoma belcheri]